MARLFFALQPDPKAREALAAVALDVAHRHGGRAVPAPRIHLTLAFLGEIEAARIDRARTAAQGIAASAFELSMDRIGSFARQSLAWAAPGRTPEELTILHEGLAARLREAGFALERRRFSAHVTIARRIERPVIAADMGPIAWRVLELALVESDLATGAYRDLARWPLPGPDEGNRAS